MKYLHTITLALSALILASCGNNVFESPNKSLRGDIDGQSLTIYYNDTIAVTSIHLGLITENMDLDNGMVLKNETKPLYVSEEYDMPTGKRSHCFNSANEKLLSYQNESGQILDVIVRLYNDGVAIRYSIPKEEKVIEEKTSFSIKDGVNRWIAWNDFGNEQPFPYETQGKKTHDRYMRERTNQQWGYPALAEPENGLFMLISEADLRRGDSGSYLDNSSDEETYCVKLVDPAPFRDGLSPWRFAIIGTLADIAESTLVTDLSSPSKIFDESWIEPGVSSWIYWAYNHSSKDFQIVKEYIDLAAEMGWPYCLIDWEWPEMANGGDINDALAYAKEKGVKINLWYNSGTSWVGESAPQPQDRLNSAENREKEMQWLEDNGVTGIKVDFFSPDNDTIVNYYLDILEDAARHHLLVDFHGCTIPKGWQRTWPNMMSMEAIYGAEWYNNYPLMTKLAPAHNATIPFTRNVIGPMDYTPGAFTDSQHPHITTNAHELALPVLFESGLQHMADRPAGFAALPEEAQALYKGLPSVWDDTMLLEGYPGKSAVMARRSGGTWYIAGINGLEEAQDLTFSIERLHTNAETALMFTDGETDREIKVSNASLETKELTIHCNPRGGFLIKL